MFKDLEILEKHFILVVIAVQENQVFLLLFSDTILDISAQNVISKDASILSLLAQLFS